MAAVIAMQGAAAAAPPAAPAALAPVHGSLFEITDHLVALLDTLDMIETEPERALCEADIRAYLEAEIRKVDSIAGYLAHCEAQQLGAVAEMKRLETRKRMYERREQRLTLYVIGIMQQFGVKKLEGRSSTFALRACPPSVLIGSEAAIPAEFKIVKQEIVVDKKAIKAAIEAGAEVPGALLATDKVRLART
jgi:hypothetical protein